MPLSTNPKIQISTWAQISTFLLKEASGLELLPLSPGRRPSHGTGVPARQVEAGGIALMVLLSLRAFLPLPLVCLVMGISLMSAIPAHFHMVMEQFWPEMLSEEMPP